MPAGAEPVTPAYIEEYLRALTPPRDPVLTGLEEDARRDSVPIVGPLVGRFLQVLARGIAARRIFELGSATGYSTLWLARALADGGEVHYTERDAGRIATARAAFERAGLAGRIVVHEGDALEALRSVPGPFDMIFNDLDKRFYPRALSEGVPRLRAGGLWVSDNALWDGRAARTPPADDDTAAIQRHNREAYARPDLDCALVPLRDGLLVATKRSP